MEIICIWPRNKNALIKFEQKQPKHKKYKKNCSKFLKKCMKNVINLKNEGYVGLTNMWGQKPLMICGGKRQETLDWIGWERKGRKREKTILKKWWTCEEKSILFFFSFQFRSVEYRSGTNRARQKVCFKNF